MYLSTWCMEISKYLYLYLYLTKSILYLASNFQVLFIKKCKSSYLFEYIIITVSILGTTTDSIVGFVAISLELLIHDIFVNNIKGTIIQSQFLILTENLFFMPK